MEMLFFHPIKWLEVECFARAAVPSSSDFVSLTYILYPAPFCLCKCISHYLFCECLSDACRVLAFEQCLASPLWGRVMDMPRFPVRGKAWKLSHALRAEATQRRDPNSAHGVWGMENASLKNLGAQVELAGHFGC